MGYRAVSLPILGLDVSTFYGKRYLCANYVSVMDNVCREALSYGAVSLPIVGLVSTFYGKRYLCANYVSVMDNVCREALSGLNVSTFYGRRYLCR